MTVPVKKWLDKIPGGIIIVPLFLGCLINTFFPAALQIGSFTTGIVKGTSALVGLFFVCMGAQLDLKCAPQAMKTGFTITIVKFAVSVAIGLLAARFFNNSLFGLSALAIIAAASNSNGALFGALAPLESVLHVDQPGYLEAERELDGRSLELLQKAADLGHTLADSDLTVEGEKSSVLQVLANLAAGAAPALRPQQTSGTTPPPEGGHDAR